MTRLSVLLIFRFSENIYSHSVATRNISTRKGLLLVVVDGMDRGIPQFTGTPHGDKHGALPSASRAARKLIINSQWSREWGFGVHPASAADSSPTHHA